MYWLVLAFLLLLPEIFGNEKKRLTWKDWVPTFISAPLVFPFCMLKARYRDALLGVEDKDKPTKKEKKK